MYRTPSQNRPGLSFSRLRPPKPTSPRIHGNPIAAAISGPRALKRDYSLESTRSGRDDMACTPPGVGAPWCSCCCPAISLACCSHSPASPSRIIPALSNVNPRISPSCKPMMKASKSHGAMTFGRTEPPHGASSAIRSDHIAVHCPLSLEPFARKSPNRVQTAYIQYLGSGR